jgi:hypothetical protein
VVNEKQEQECCAEEKGIFEAYGGQTRGCYTDNGLIL